MTIIFKNEGYLIELCGKLNKMSETKIQQKEYICESCESSKSSKKDEKDEFWYNLREKHFLQIPTLCCAMVKCSYCLQPGTWYQKYEECLCELCYDQEINKKCIELFCGYTKEKELDTCKSCKEHYCRDHLYGDDRCKTCFGLDIE